MWLKGKGNISVVGVGDQVRRGREAPLYMLALHKGHSVDERGGGGKGRRRCKVEVGGGARSIRAGASPTSRLVMKETRDEPCVAERGSRGRRRHKREGETQWERRTKGERQPSGNEDRGVPQHEEGRLEGAWARLRLRLSYR